VERSSDSAEQVNNAEPPPLSSCLFTVPVPPRIARLLRLRAADFRTFPESLIAQIVAVAIVPERQQRQRLLELDLIDLWGEETDEMRGACGSAGTEPTVDRSI
jgi:hypothetical protein